MAPLSAVPESLSHFSPTIRDLMIEHTSNSTSNSTSLLSCVLNEGQIVISRTALIVAITICIFFTCISGLLILVLLWREYDRRQQAKAAKAWGRQSRLRSRISTMRKEVDDQFRQQYQGCLHNPHENPELGSNDRVELMSENVAEAPATPLPMGRSHGKGLGVTVVEDARSKRKSKGISLFFDNTVSLWLPKR